MPTQSRSQPPRITCRSCSLAIAGLPISRETLKEGFQAGANPPACFGGGPSSVSLRLEAEVDRLGLAPGDRDFLLLRAVVFMPRGDFIFSRGQVRQRERAIVLADRVMIGLEHHEPAVHPGMDVALHRNKFRRVKFLAD